MFQVNLVGLQNDLSLQPHLSSLGGWIDAFINCENSSLILGLST